VINCELIVENSCYLIDDMFGYVNLMIIKLFMLNLHAQVI